MMNSKMEKKRKSNINSELPLQPELIKLILLKLPSGNLPSCRLVCKVWNNLVLTSTVEALICAQNWLRSNAITIDLRPHLEEVCRVEEDFNKFTLDEATNNNMDKTTRENDNVS
ncbi:uncharacterized protein LOC111021635 [Momordica charantia]|uniref:Uncharacterized protein LOC111021635 n=1 Tax=Momordica charantia TaxID=3673 RepID=A0A6J1DJD5_MOMCH|nr:uncharacterized protein LOC111021635 [Momordica charantia]